MHNIPSSAREFESSPPLRRKRRPYDIIESAGKEPEVLPPSIVTPITHYPTPSPVHTPPVPTNTTTIQPVSKPAATVDAILSGQLSGETKRAYRTDLKQFLAYLGHFEVLDMPQRLVTVLQTVTRGMASEYRDHLLEVRKMSASSVNRHLSTLNTVFNALKEEDIIAKNPFSWVKRPKVSNAGKTPAFTKEQAERILAQPDLSTLVGKRDRIMLLLMFFCGLRRSEVVKVETDDFYESQGCVMLRVHGKGRSDKSDSVMVPATVWAEIRDYISGKEGLLFTGQSGNGKYNDQDKPISTTRLYIMFKGYCRKAGIDPEGFSPHSTRATFITLCLKGGADVRSVMYAARHSDPSTTIRYDRQRLDMENHATRHLHLNIPVREMD